MDQKEQEAEVDPRGDRRDGGRGAGRYGHIGLLSPAI